MKEANFQIIEGHQRLSLKMMFNFNIHVQKKMYYLLDLISDITKSQSCHDLFCNPPPKHPSNPKNKCLASIIIERPFVSLPPVAILTQQSQNCVN